jgi:hypothetical protein
MQKSRASIYILLMVYGIAITMIYHHLQPSNKFAENPLADANEYLKIYEYFKNHEADYSVRHGIHQRIAIPFLAAILPGQDATQQFYLVNSFFAVLTLPMFYFFLSYFKVKKEFIFPVILYFSLHWAGPFRQNAIDPVNVDMPVYLFEMILVLLLIQRKYYWLILLIPFAVAVKEISLAFLVVYLIYTQLMRFVMKDKTVSVLWAFGLLLTGLSTSVVINYYFPSSAPGITPLHILAFHLKENILHPVYFVRWLLSLFAAMGALLFLFRPSIRHLLSEDKSASTLVFFCISGLALSWLGGMDYTRLIFIGFPWIITMILVLSKPTRLEFFAAISISLVISRFWMVVPVIGKDLSPYNAWMPEYASAPWLITWTFVAFCCLGLMAAIHVIQKRQSKAIPSGK